MPLLFWVVPYIIAGGVMWFVSSQTAPFGREIKLSQAIVAVILMGLCSAVSSYWLKPVIGSWRFLAEFVAWTLVVMLTLQLSFTRSLVAVIIYFVVMVVALIVMGIIAKSGGTAPNPIAAPNRRLRLGPVPWSFGTLTSQGSAVVELHRSA